MTYKKTIIGGVDVSECKHFKNATCIADYLLTDMNFSQAKCELCKNCHYKQLARKTAECEKYKQALDEIEEIIGGTYYETEQTVKFKMQDIQDIINIAKEQS